MFMKHRYLGLIFIVCAISICFFAFHHSKKSFYKEPEQSALSVNIYPITFENFDLTKEFIGRVMANQSQNVFPMISGYISDVLVKGGDTVSIGEVLFVLDQEMYRAKVLQAEATVLQTKSEMENAKIYLERIQKTPSKAVSDNLLDNAVNSYKMAEANYFASLAALEQAHVELSYTVLRSQINGIIGNVDVSVGDYVSPEKNLAYVLQISPIKIVFSISGKDYLNPKFFDDWDTQIILLNGEIYSEKPSLIFIDNQFSSITHDALVYALVKNNQALLLPNSTVTVRLVKHIEKGILIPQTAVVMTDKENAVYVLRQGIVVYVPITINGQVGDKYYISGKLLPHDQLILDRITEQEVGQRAKGIVQ